MNKFITEAINDIHAQGYVSHWLRVTLSHYGVNVDALEERHKQSPKE